MHSFHFGNGNIIANYLYYFSPRANSSPNDKTAAKCQNIFLAYLLSQLSTILFLTSYLIKSLLNLKIKPQIQIRIQNSDNKSKTSDLLHSYINHLEKSTYLFKVVFKNLTHVVTIIVFLTSC